MVKCKVFTQNIKNKNPFKMEEEGEQPDMSENKFFSWVLLFHYPGHKYAEAWENVNKGLLFNTVVYFPYFSRNMHSPNW